VARINENLARLKQKIKFEILIDEKFAQKNKIKKQVNHINDLLHGINERECLKNKDFPCHEKIIIIGKVGLPQRIKK